MGTAVMDRIAKIVELLLLETLPPRNQTQDKQSKYICVNLAGLSKNEHFFMDIGIDFTILVLDD
jgi:hypothetical protein